MRSQRLKILLNHVATIYIGIVFVVLFWIVESAVHVFVLHERNLIQQIFMPAPHEIWMRLLVMGAVIIFAIFAQFMFNRQKRAKEATEHAYAELNQIFETSANGMRLVVKDFKVFRVNETFLTLTGVSRDEAVNKRCYETFRGPMCHTPECPLTRVLGGEELVVCEIEKERNDGRIVPCVLVATPFVGPDGELIGIVENFKDVTERVRAVNALQKAHDEMEQRVEERTAELTDRNKQFKLEISERKLAEEALRKSEARFRKMTEKRTAGIVIVDRNGTVRFANVAAKRLFGLRGEELVGRMFGFPLTAGGSTEINIIRRHAEAAVAEMGVVEMEWEGEIAYIASLHDISERKRTEEALKKSRDELEKALSELTNTQTKMIQSEKMASIGQLAAGVAHEINNPTGFVSSNINTLSDYHNDIGRLLVEYRKLVSDLKDNMAGNQTPSSVYEQVKRLEKLESEVDIDFILNDSKELIKESQEGTERIKKIVFDLKDFAHPGEDKLQSADINNCLESTLNVVWNELKYKATVTKEYGDLPLVECYPQQLNQVFMNLFVNAAQAIGEKGEIKIVTRAVDGYAEIKISDTGSGIPKENLSKIFEPFFTTKEVGKGTGLGLNVVYKIIEKHKGTIDAESIVGKGTTFIIRIPVETDA